MTDPDAASSNPHSRGEWLHWLISDIPGGTLLPLSPTNLYGASEIMTYEKPAPPSGVHRYVFVLAVQGESSPTYSSSTSRSGFNTGGFFKTHNLVPVGGLMFKQRSEPNLRTSTPDRIRSDNPVL